jgi:hypothetical protein
MSTLRRARHLSLLASLSFTLTSTGFARDAAVRSLFSQRSGARTDIRIMRTHVSTGLEVLYV